MISINVEEALTEFSTFHEALLCTYDSRTGQRQDIGYLHLPPEVFSTNLFYRNSNEPLLH